MALPRDSFQEDLRKQITEGWRDFIHSMEESLNMLEKDIDEAAEMSEKCTGEWCEATEHVIDVLLDRKSVV